MIRIGTGYLGWNTYFKLFRVLKQGGFIKINNDYGLKFESANNGMKLALYRLGEEEEVPSVVFGMTDVVPKKQKAKPKVEKEAVVQDAGEEELF